MGVIHGSMRHTVSGRKKKVTRRKTISHKTGHITNISRLAYRRSTPEYASVAETTGVAARVEAPRYTGTLVKGIGTMHKSNAIPIIDEEQIRDLARMRR